MHGKIPLILVLFTISIISCQGNPTVPAVNSDAKIPTASEARTEGAHQCLGFHYFALDTRSMKISLIPARATDLHLNVTGVLNTAFGVKVSFVPGESEPQNGIFTFDITLEHPFGTKPGLAGFDVKGILLTPGTLAVGSLMFADTDETRLENADGYTRWWNPIEFPQEGMFGYTQGMYAKTPAANLTATVNPYKYFADALGANDDLT
ncbi:MAG: hypothetical protein ABIC40_00395, partial [bacterium]